MNKLNRNKKFVRVVSLALLQVFLGWNLSSAAVSDRSLWHQRGKLSVGTSVSGNSLVQEDLQKSLFSEFFVPENAGTINEFWVPAGMTTKEALSSSKLLIHIRDAHCNYEAQQNIAKIIENFTKTNGVSLVAVEGAEGKIDYSSLNAYPNYDVRNDVSDYFMEQGRLCGAEFANINADKYFTLYGAEKSSVYNSNLDHFRENLKFKEEGVKFVSQVKSALESLKAQMYTPELKDIEEKLSLYNAREISFVDYCQYLYSLPAAEKVRGGYKNFALLMEAIKAQELVDFSQIDAEKDALLAAISKDASAEELMDISRNALDFRLGKISTAAFYDGLKGIAEAKKIDLASYKNLKPYMVYLSVYEKINSTELFKEKETLEAEVKRSLFKNTDQARLDKLSKNADIVEKIFSVRLTNDDLKYFTSNRTDFTAYEFESFINEQAPKYNVTVNVDFSSDPLEKHLGKLEAFYNEAKTRDELLAQNALSAMEQSGTNVGVVVAGGFHTAGMTTFLRSKNIAYMVVTPRILQEDVNNPYLKLISGENLPVEKLLSVEHLFGLAVPIKQKANAAAINGAMELADAGKAVASNGTNLIAKQGNDYFVVFKVQKGASDAEKKAAAAAAVASLNNTDIEVDPNGAIIEIAQNTASQKALKGPRALAANEALIATAIAAGGDANVISLGTLATQGGFGSRVAALLPLIATYGVSAADAADVKAVSPKDAAKYPYEGLVLQGKTTAQAIQDQDNGRVVSGEALVSQRTLARLLARAEVAAPAQAEAYKKAAAAVAAHEALVKQGKTDGQVKQATDDVALAGTPFAGQRLSDVFDFLDIKGTNVTPELEAAQANLAKAEDAFIANPSRATALPVVEAELALRGLINANSASENARANDDAVLVATLVENGFLGLDLTNSKLVRAAAVPELGQSATSPVETKVPASVVKLFSDRGVNSLVVGGDATAAAKAQVLKNLLSIDRKLALTDAVELNNGVTGAIALLVNDGSNLRLVIQSTVADAKAESDLANAYALANGQGVAPVANELFIYTVDADAVTANDQSRASFVASVAAFTKNNAVRFQVKSLGNDPKNTEAALKLLSDAKLDAKLISDADASKPGLTIKARRTFTTTANKGSVPANELVEIENKGGDVVPFHAAVPVVYLKDAGLAGSYQSLVVRLLTDLYGRAPVDAEINNFIRGTTIILPRVGKFEINLSVKLAIAA